MQQTKEELFNFIIKSRETKIEEKTIVTPKMRFSKNEEYLLGIITELQEQNKLMKQSFNDSLKESLDSVIEQNKLMKESLSYLQEEIITQKEINKILKESLEVVEKNNIELNNQYLILPYSNSSIIFRKNIEKLRLDPGQFVIDWLDSFGNNHSTHITTCKNNHLLPIWFSDNFMDKFISFVSVSTIYIYFPCYHNYPVEYTIWGDTEKIIEKYLQTHKEKVELYLDLIEEKFINYIKILKKYTNYSLTFTMSNGSKIIDNHLIKKYIHYCHNNDISICCKKQNEKGEYTQFNL